MKFQEFLEKELENLKVNHLYRQLKYSKTFCSKFVEVNGKKLLNFSSNDYLALAQRFSPKCLEKWKTGSGASRLLSGSYEVHEELEVALAKVKKTETSLLFSTGYMANVGVLTTLAGEKDVIFSDELNHASIIDGCRLSKAKVIVYPHNDVETLDFLLSKHRKNYRFAFIVTEGVFSMDGDLSPVDKLMELKKLHSAILVVDDAHATGVVGWSSFDKFSVEPDEETVIIGTCGKALGTFGAFVCSSKTVKDYLVNRCRTFIYTTALPPFIACQTLENLKLVEDRMKRLKNLTDYFSKISGIPSESAIFPVLLNDLEKLLKVSKCLFERGFFIPGIRPPTVKVPRLRISVTLFHSKEDLEKLWENINRCFQNHLPPS